MRFEGTISRQGRYWAVEVPLLGVITQGRTRADAFLMIADAIESLANKPGFNIDVFPGKGDYFEIGSQDQGTLIALLLRRQRFLSGLSLADVADRLGASSLNTYARYEQGRAVPTVAQFTRLLAAVSPTRDFVLSASRQH
jgi:hypothetical protein